MADKSHVEISEHGSAHCMFCGGSVGDDGYAELVEHEAGDTPEMTGELSLDEGEKMRHGVINSEPEQSGRTRSFVDAMKRRG